MTRSSKLWLALAVLFTVVNLLGIGLAAAAHQGPHTGLHVALSIVGVIWTWWLLIRDRRRTALASGVASDALPTDPRLDYLQQSVDAVALEVERIGEAQRYAEKLKAEKQEPPPEKS